MTEYGNFQRVDIGRQPSPDGVYNLTVLSPALGRRADLSVFAPPGHQEMSSLPIVILLHGVHGSHWSWTRNGNAHTTFAELVAKGRVRPMVLAMPSDGLFGIGSGYLPRTGEDAEAWIVSEVAEAVRLVFPRADASDVSIAGLSMGGWGALRLVGLHPTRFRAAVGMSPLTETAQVAKYAPHHLREAHNLDWPYPRLGDLLTSTSNLLPPLRITCGTDDELSGAVKQLHQELARAGISHQYAENPGSHTWDYWEEDLRNALLFIGRQQEQQSSFVTGLQP